MRVKDKKQKPFFQRKLLKGIGRKIEIKAKVISNLSEKYKTIEAHISANPADFQAVLSRRKTRDSFLRESLQILLLRRRAETGKIILQMAKSDNRKERSKIS